MQVVVNSGATTVQLPRYAAAAQQEYTVQAGLFG